MASKGKKITLLDPSGVLSKEALLGYVYNELTPATRTEVERYLAENEMYRDMVEGLQQIPNKAEAEKIMHSLNVDIAERSGSTASVPGLSENVGDFFWTNRKVAAVVGTVLLVSAAVFTFALLQVSNKENIASKEVQEQRTQIPIVASKEREEARNQPPVFAPEQTTEEEVAEQKADSAKQIAGLDEMQRQKNTVTAPQEPIDAATNAREPSMWSTTTGENDYEFRKAEDNDDSKKLPAATGNVKATTKVDSFAVTEDFAQAEDKIGYASPDQKLKSKRQEETLSQMEEQQVSDRSLMNTSTPPAYDLEKLYKEVPRTTAEQMPEFPGGQSGLEQYLRDNMKYPKDARDKGIEGKVYLNFTVGTGGRVKDIAVIQGVNKELNAEAIRLIANTPKWTPGKDQGKIVEVRVYQTIEFKIPAELPTEKK